MGTKKLLAEIATGLWRWDSASRMVTADAEAARLLGLPAQDTTLTETDARARFHPVDWNEAFGIVNLAITEDSLAEARLRVVNFEGRVLRTVRARTKPFRRQAGDGQLVYELLGAIQAVAELLPGPTVGTALFTGDWRRSREAFLLDAGRALAEAGSTSEVLRVASSLSMPGFSPDGLVVFSTSGNRLEIIDILGIPLADQEPFAGLTVSSNYPASEVVRTGRAVYLPSPGAYQERYPEIWPHIQPFQRSSWAFLPLTVAGRTIGAGMAAFKNRVAFSPDERSVLITVARMLAQALDRAGAAETERALSLGLQRSMMPTLGQQVQGVTVAARYIPTGGGLQVGGDWYDVIPLPGSDALGTGRFALVIGDVQGHDVQAASLMGQLRIALRAYAAEGHSPDVVLARTSRFLAGMGRSPVAGPVREVTAANSPRFATCLYIEVDPQTGILDIARAGHPDPIIRTADGTAVIRQTSGGMPLGIEADSDYPLTRLVLAPGETLMLCTDGLIESGGHDLLSGWDRIRPVIEAQHGESLEELADSLVHAVIGPDAHSTLGPLAQQREDDIALLLLSRDAPSPHAGYPAARRTTVSVARAEPDQLTAARHQLRRLLHDWADQDQLDSAVLMASEMITNVLTHTDGDAVLVAELSSDRGTRRLHVEVTDTSDQQPHRRRPGELSSNGRGLLVIEMLAHAWGVDPRGQGKSIWFQLYESTAPGTPQAGAASGPVRERPPHQA